MPSDPYRDARDSYDPRRKKLGIRVLWIGESRPASGAYFYISPTTSHDSLFRETMRALGWWPVGKRMSRGLDKVPFLERFRDCGYFLYDLVEVPINKGLTRSERLKRIRDAIPVFLEELPELNPDGIIIVKAPLFTELEPMLRETRYYSRLLHQQPMPFPGSGGAINYRAGVTSALRGFPLCR